MFFQHQALCLQEHTPKLSVDDCDPDGLACRKVNVTTGEFLLSETDATVLGPTKINVQRSYRSRDGWSYFPHTMLVIGESSEQAGCTEKGRPFKFVQAFCGEKSGSVLSYFGRMADGDDSQLECNTTGLVNCTGKEISGRTNPNNNKMRFISENNSFELTTGNGTKRLYSKPNILDNSSYLDVLDGPIFKKASSLVTNPTTYFLKSELCPNGNRILYFYDEKGRLKEVISTCGSEKTIFGTIKIEYRLSNGHSEIAITTNGEREILYSFDEDENGLPRLREVLTQTSKTQYQYAYGMLIKKECIDHSFDAISYYTDGDSRGRVRSLSTLHDRFDFSYALGPKSSNTSVIDQHNNTTNYLYSDHRISCVEKYDSKHVLLQRRRKFFNKRAEGTNLISEAMEDANGKIVSCTVYGYDRNGNVAEEKLYGNLTGKEILSIHLQPNGIPDQNSNIPCHVKKRTYSHDGLNLLVSQGDSKNGMVRYAYREGTDLISSQLIYDENTLRKRIFSEYDENGSLIRQVTDDASQEHTNSRLFSEKQIIDVTVSTEYPVGLPLTVTEKYYDKVTCQERVSKHIHQTYDKRGMLLSKEIEGSTGERKPICSYRYDAEGRIIEETDPKGITYRYAYDDSGVLIRKGSDRSTYQYFYDQKGLLVRKEEIYPSGGKFEERFEYDSFGNRTSSTDVFGNTTLYEFDSFSRVTRVLSPEVFEKNLGLVRPELRYTYDSFDRISSARDPKGQITRFSYTIRGDYSLIQYPDGSKDLFSYDVEGSLHRKATHDGIVCVYLYDFLGRTRQVERFDQGEKGPGEFLGEQVYQYSTFHLISVCDERRYITAHVYDEAGRLIRIEGTQGWKEGEKKPKTCFEYDAFGRVVSTKEWFGSGEDEYRRTTNTYDLYDRVLETTIESSDGTISSHEEYTYDGSGERTTKTSRGRLCELIEYNDRHEPIRMVDALGREWRLDYGYSERDEHGQKIHTRTVVDVLGTKKTYSYDPRGALTAVSSEDSHGKLLAKSLFSYDLSMNTSEELHLRLIEGREPEEQRTVFSYDSMGRPLTTEKRGAVNQTKTTLVYNQRGQLTKRYESGLKSPIDYSYRYDLYGSHVRITYPINTAVPEGSCNKKDFLFHELTFDAEGLVTNLFSSGGIEVRRQYGFLKQVLEEKFFLKRIPSYTLKRSTDAFGRTTAIRLPDASAIHYTYDGALLKQVARLSSGGETRYIHTYNEYDPNGNLQKETLIEQVGERRTERDSALRKTDIISHFYKEHIARDGFDSLGNILTTEQETPVRDFISSYSYNELSQLVAEDGAFTHSYGCDSLGNHRTFDQKKCVINGLNQLVSTPSLTCTYDAQGCLATKTTPSGLCEFSYDALRCLTRVNKDGEEARYLYDGLGRRLIQQQGPSSNPTSTLFLYLDDEEIGLVTSAGEILQLKIPGLENSVAFEFEQVVLAPVYDMQNNVVCVIDPERQQVRETYEYSAFGEERIYDHNGNEIERSGVGNPWRFAGKRTDEISGCIFFRARDYDPQLRRWTSPDPGGEIDGPNLYLYAKANPLTYLDELGYSSHSYYVRHENFQAYVSSERSTNKDRGGELGSLENRSSPDYPRHGSFVTVYSTKYTQEQIIDKLKHEPGYSSRVIGHINGINTSLETIDRRAYRMLEEYRDKIDAVIIAYNSTEGLIRDLHKAREDINHMGSQSYRDIKQGLTQFFDNFRGTETDIRIAFHCHSHGAAIMDCLLRSTEFSDDLSGGYKRFLGPIFTYGGATFIPSGTNFVARFDIVPLFNADNRSIVRNHPECVRYTSFRLQSPLAAHEFDGPSYQEAFQYAIHQK